MDEILHAGLQHYLTLGIILFSLGCYGAIVRKGASATVIGAGLMLLGGFISLAALSAFGTSGGSIEIGRIVTLAIMVPGLAYAFLYGLVSRLHATQEGDAK